LQRGRRNSPLQNDTDNHTRTAAQQKHHIARAHAHLSRMRAQGVENAAGGNHLQKRRSIVKTGRKLAIVVDPKLLDRICNLLRQGCSVRTTCECVGLSQSCFFDYMRRSNPDATDHDPRFLEFAERATRARGEGKARLVALVNEAATHDWRAAVALLERLSPAEYGRTAPPESSSIARTDSGTLEELLRQALGSSNPDPERIARLRLTLQEVQAANAELLRLVAEWTAGPGDVLPKEPVKVILN
jgi:hypothetical protein